MPMGGWVKCLSPVSAKSNTIEVTGDSKLHHLHHVFSLFALLVSSSLLLRFLREVAAVTFGWTIPLTQTSTKSSDSLCSKFWVILVKYKLTGVKTKPPLQTQHPLKIIWGKTEVFLCWYLFSESGQNIWSGQHTTIPPRYMTKITTWDVSSLSGS